MLYNTMLHNTLMYVTPCYITCICYVACYITCDNTASVYYCRQFYCGGSTGAPEWQLLDWDDYDFPEDAGGAGGGGGAADPLAAMLEGLPSFAERYSITCSG